LGLPLADGDALAHGQPVEDDGLGDDPLGHQGVDHGGHTGVGFGVVVEGDDGVSGQVALPGGEVLADGVLAVVSVDEQQADLGAGPGGSDLVGESLDHGDAVPQAALADLADGVLPDGGIGEVQSAGSATGGGAVAGKVVGVHGPHMGAQAVSGTGPQPAGRSAPIGAQLDDGLVLGDHGRQLVQGHQGLDGSQCAQ